MLIYLTLNTGKIRTRDHCIVHLQVVSVGHSSLNFAGQPLPNGEERLVILVRDRPQKAFFIKVVDPQVKKNTSLSPPTLLPKFYLSAFETYCCRSILKGMWQ